MPRAGRGNRAIIGLGGEPAMLQQAIDLREEGVALHAFLAGLEDADWARPNSSGMFECR